MTYRLVLTKIFAAIIVLIYVFLVWDHYTIVKKKADMVSSIKTEESASTRVPLLSGHVSNREDRLSTRRPDFRKRSYNLQTSKKNQLHITTIEQLLAYVGERRWPLIVLFSTGRLANNLHTFALTLVLEQLYPNATYGISDNVHKFVETILAPESFTLPVFKSELIFGNTTSKILTIASQPKLVTGDLENHMETKIRSSMGQKIILLLEGYPIRFLSGYQDFLFKKLKFKEELQIKAEKFFNQTMQKVTNSMKIKSSQITFVGFHIRRTDYVRYVRKYHYIPSLPGKLYYERAMEYFRKHLDFPVFIVISDDSSYAKNAFKNVNDVIIKENGTAAEDLALLSSCSHAIMTMGSFGFWGSFLTGGNVVYALLDESERVPFVHPIRMGEGFENFIGIRFRF